MVAGLFGLESSTIARSSPNPRREKETSESLPPEPSGPSLPGAIMHRHRGKRPTAGYGISVTISPSRLRPCAAPDSRRESWASPFAVPERGDGCGWVGQRQWSGLDGFGDCAPNGLSSRSLVNAEEQPTSRCHMCRLSSAVWRARQGVLSLSAFLRRSAAASRRLSKRFVRCRQLLALEPLF